MPKKIDLSELFGSPVKQDDRLFSRPIAQLHEFYLSGEIESSENYIEWFQTIRHASEADIIKIYINSPGGDAFTAIQFIRALQETDATIIMSVEGMCASAATMIFLQGHSFEVSEHSAFMVHSYSSGIVGKGHEIHSQAMFDRGWSETMLREIYKDFLTEKEITRVLDGADLWMEGDAVIRRLKAKGKKMQKEKKEVDKSAESE
jgi:ATP-dependent protease ClpP protease subunit